MNLRLSITFALAAALLGCNSAKTQRAPSLVAAPAANPAPQRNYIKEAGDTTWQVVTAPTRLVTPPKKAEPKKPEVYETPSAVIIQSRYTDDDAPASRAAGKQ